MPTNLDYKKIMTDLDEVGFHIIPSVIPEKKADEARDILEQLLKEEATEQSLAVQNAARRAHRRQAPHLSRTHVPPDHRNPVAQIPR